MFGLFKNNHQPPEVKSKTNITKGLITKKNGEEDED
jgi:hypothetical protein